MGNDNNNKSVKATKPSKRAAFNLWTNTRDIFVRPDQRMPLIDGVRAFSILYVLVFHGLVAMAVLLTGDTRTEVFREFVQDTPWYWQWVLMGDRGVDAFFVISGFLIGQILFREYEKTGGINLKRFFIRRWLRLTPVYMLVIVVFAVLAGPHIVGSLMENRELSLMQALGVFLGSMLAYATYVNNFLPFEQGNYIPFAWSLAAEEQFYILFSLFMAFAYGRIQNKLRFLLLLFAASFFIRWLLFYLNPHLLVTGDLLLGGPKELIADYWEIIYSNLYTRFGAVILGIILAYLYVYNWQQVVAWMDRSRSNLLVFIAFLLAGSMSVLPIYTGEEIPMWMHYLYHVGHRNLFSLAVALLILTALFPFGIGGMIGRILSSRFFYPISQLSYSIYLVHLPLLVICALLLRATGNVQELSYGNMFIVLAFAMPFIFFFSAILYVLIERPFMKLRRP